MRTPDILEPSAATQSIARTSAATRPPDDPAVYRKHQPIVPSKFGGGVDRRSTFLGLSRRPVVGDAGAAGRAAHRRAHAPSPDDGPGGVSDGQGQRKIGTASAKATAPRDSKDRDHRKRRAEEMGAESPMKMARGWKLKSRKRRHTCPRGRRQAGTTSIWSLPADGDQQRQGDYEHNSCRRGHPHSSRS